MRKTITVVLTGALIFGALIAPSAEAGKRVKKRTAKASYTGFSASVEGNGFCDPGCVTFSTKPSERFVQIKITDATGLPVSGQVTQPDSNGDGFVESVGAFCGKSKKLAIRGGQEVSIFLYGHPTTGVFQQFGGPTECQGTATTGKVTATFSNR